MKAKHAGGRPKKTLDDIPKNWRELIISKMSEGVSQEELILELGISWDLFWRLAKEEKEFSSTVKKGMELCKAWWMKTGRMNMGNKNFSPVLWYMNMKNRFGWKDKTETDLTSDGRALEFKVISYKDANHGKNNPV